MCQRKGPESGRRAESSAHRSGRLVFFWALAGADVTEIDARIIVIARSGSQSPCQMQPRAEQSDSGVCGKICGTVTSHWQDLFILLRSSENRLRRGGGGRRSISPVSIDIRPRDGLETARPGRRSRRRNQAHFVTFGLPNDSAEYGLSTHQDCSMKVRNSLKSLRGRHRNNRLVRRKGRVYVINKVQRRFKARQG